MNKKNIILIFLIVCFILISFFILKNKLIKEEVIEEYIPEQEIKEEDSKETFILLYFKNIEENKIVPEMRKVDANNLIKYPYEYLINLLLNGSNNQSLKNTIPNDTKLNSVELKGDVLYINFSNEFVNAQSEDEENVINQVLFTVTQLNEVNGIKILIEGEEDKSFIDEKVNFNEIFYKKN